MDEFQLIEDLIDELDALIDMILNQFDSELETVLTRCADNIIAELARLLPVDSEGNIISDNFQLTTVTPDTFTAAMAAAGFTALIGTFVDSYTKLVKPAGVMYGVIAGSGTSNIDAAAVEKLHNLQKLDIKYFEAISKDAASVMHRATYDHVLSGGRFDTLVNEFRAALTGTGSPLARHSRTYAQDAIMRWTRTMNMLALPKTGYWYYAGTTIARTRKFCRDRVGRTFPDAEVESWNGMSWQGKAPGDVKINCGGYNCRHSLLPVRKELADKNSR